MSYAMFIRDRFPDQAEKAASNDVLSCESRAIRELGEAKIHVFVKGPLALPPSAGSLWKNFGLCATTIGDQCSSQGSRLSKVVNMQSCAYLREPCCM